MPWTAADATKHQKKATTAALRHTWATVANNILKETGDDARAIRGANAAVDKQLANPPRLKKA